MRVEDVAVGAGVSLLVGLLLWPRGATTILRGAIGAAYDGAARYLDATITALLGDGEQAHSSRAAREAFDTAQLLDAAMRDYLANRGSARRRINDLTLLATGAGRVRRVARLLQDAHSFMRSGADRRRTAAAGQRPRRPRRRTTGPLRVVRVVRESHRAGGVFTQS